MRRKLPHGAAVVVLGTSAAALGRRVCDLSTAMRGCTVLAQLAGEWDEAYDRAVPHIADLFAAGRPIVGLCASGILIRALAPLCRRQARRAAGRRPRGGRFGRGAAARRASRRQPDRPRAGRSAGRRRGDHHRRRPSARPRARRAAIRLAHRQPGTDQAHCRRAPRRRARRARRCARRRRLAARDGHSLGRKRRAIRQSDRSPRDCRRDRTSFPSAGAGAWASAASAAAIPRRSPNSPSEASAKPGSPRARSAAVVSVELKLAEPGIHALAETARRAGAVLFRRALARRNAAPNAKSPRRRFAPPAAGASPRARRWRRRVQAAR